jgi:hypothetical protein
LNLILILKELWHRRLLVAIAILVAAAVSLVAVYQVSLSPPAISQRADVKARGSIEILVDSARSPIADARRDLSGLTARAGVFARYIVGGNVVGQIAKANGLRAKQIDVTGPEPLPGEAPGAGEEAPQIHPYGIAIVQSEELPILTVITRAPTVEEARGLAAAAPAAVRRVVRSIQAQQQTPLDKRVEFRVLGPAKAAPVDDTLGKKVALALFVFLLVLFVVAILAVPRLIAAWRSAEPKLVATPAPTEPQVGPDPDVLQFAGGRNGEAIGADQAELDRTAGET